MNKEHVNNLNTLESLEKQGFEGIDINLDISLFEYGIAWREYPEENEILIIYSLNDRHSRFDRCTLALDLDFWREFDWVKRDSFLDTLGIDQKEFDALPLSQKIFDLVGYFGRENVFGSCYWEGFPIIHDETPIVIHRTYETITEESAQLGDAEERGFDSKNETIELCQLASELRGTESSSSPILINDAGRVWFTHYGEMNPYSGEYRNESIHLANPNNEEQVEAWTVAIKQAGFTVQEN